MSTSTPPAPHPQQGLSHNQGTANRQTTPYFLAYYLLSPQQQYGLLGTANGATVAHVNIPTIRNLKIDVPDLDKQVKIVICFSYLQPQYRLAVSTSTPPAPHPQQGLSHNREMNLSVIW
mgnify:CR=1 FL=1